MTKLFYIWTVATIIATIVLLAAIPSFAGSWRTGIRVYDNDMYLRYVIERPPCSVVYGCKVWASDRVTILYYIKDSQILDKDIYRRQRIEPNK